MFFHILCMITQPAYLFSTFLLFLFHFLVLSTFCTFHKIIKFCKYSKYFIFFTFYIISQFSSFYILRCFIKFCNLTFCVNCSMPSAFHILHKLLNFSILRNSAGRAGILHNCTKSPSPSGFGILHEFCKLPRFGILRNFTNPFGLCSISQNPS